METNTPNTTSILIVEDDHNLADSLADLFRQEGYRVTKAARVHDAILKLMNQRFNCVLVDLRLEGGDGEQVVSHIRNDRALSKNTAVIVMSGFLNQGIVSRMGSRVAGILVKPFDPVALIRRVESLLKPMGA
jgi:DNA-binding response OmpR family regulator